jgi:hypothetical protein
MEKEICQAHVLVRSSKSNKDRFKNYNRVQRKVVIDNDSLGIQEKHRREFPKEIPRRERNYINGEL